MQVQSLDQELRKDAVRPDDGIAALPLPHVLYVVNLNPTGKFGSLEEQITLLHEAFRNQGRHFVPVFTFPFGQGMTDNLLARGVDAHCLDMQQFRLGTLARLRRLIHDHAIEIVHWQFTEPLWNPYLWSLSALCPGVRHVYSDRISRCTGHQARNGWCKRMIKRSLLARYARTACVSHYVRDRLVEQGSWANVRVCPHFINTDRFAPDAMARTQIRREHGDEGRFVVTVVAQLIAEKGIDVLIRALTELPESVVSWIVGTGPMADELQTLCRSLGVEERVRFFGQQTNVVSFLHGADCLVLPSRWQEAAGLALLEAQSCELPVIASRVGGIPEYLDEGRTGLLFEPENAGELAEHLRRLCHDDELCRRMGVNARRRMVDLHSVEAQMPNWLEFYRS